MGTTLKKVDDPDIIEPIQIDRRTLPVGQYHEVDYEARQVFDICRVVTEYRAQVLEDDSGNRRSFMSDTFIIENFPMGEIEFEKRYNTVQACIDYLAKMKWPDGFICRNCGHKAYWFSSKHLFICTRCEHSHSLTAGTVMHGNKKPLNFWFKAMWWFTTRKSGENTINLKELLGLGSYQTAWAWLHKFRRCTTFTDANLFRAMLKLMSLLLAARSLANSIVAPKEKPSFLQTLKKMVINFAVSACAVVPDCSGDVLEQFVSTNITLKSTVATDGWKGDNFASKNYNHRKTIASKTDDKSSVPPGVHRIASLVKRLILGTFQGRFGPEHLQSYINEYVFRFNLRTSRNIGKKFMRIAQQVTSSTKVSYNQIIGGASPFCLLAN